MNDIFSTEQIPILVQNIPKYLYIKFFLINRIKSAELPVGSRLATELEMCITFSCSRITVRKALEELLQEGYIYKVHGFGSFVKERIPQKQNLSGITSCSALIRSQNMIASKKIFSSQVVTCNKEVSQRLNIAEKSPVLEYIRVYFANGIPVIYACSYFNISLLPGIDNYNLSNQSVITLLKEKYDLEIRCANRDLRAILSDKMTSQLLGVPEQFPLLQVTDLKTGIIQGSEIPVEYYTMLYVTERIRYSPEI